MSLKIFANQYQVSKTLRFELIPVGKTLENIEKNGIIQQDERRAEEYKEVKKIIDKFHKRFIEESLKDFSFAENSLKNYVEVAKTINRSDKQKEDFGKIQNELCKEIVKKFDTKHLFGKELIQEDLCNFIENSDLSEFYKKENLNKEKCVNLVNNFKKWTTYFTGFHENRKNMYSNEEKSTAIAYRLINDNLPKFIGNISIFEKIKDVLRDRFDIMKNTLGLSEDIEYFFNLDNYSKFITQSGIDLFNLVIGGKTLENKTKIQGLNEYINLYNQQQKEKNERLPKFTPLFKMILSDRTALSWLPEEFEKDNEVLEAIGQFYLSVVEKREGDLSVFERLEKLLLEMKSGIFDLNKIYLRNDTSLTKISQKHFGHWGEIQKLIEERYEKENPKNTRKSQEKYGEEKEKYFKRFDSISLKFINECSEKQIENYFFERGEEKDENGKIIKETLFETVLQNYKIIEQLLNMDYPSNQKLSQNENDVTKIKEFLDSIMDLLHFVKPLCGKGNESDKDEKFYGEFVDLFEKLKEITKLYDKVRNYMTKKPYSVEKIKLNFENSTLCNGWDKNKEQDNTAILLRKANNYYLAIMNYTAKTKFDDAELATEKDEFYEKIDYKLLPGPNKMLPKVFFSEKGRGVFNPSAEILEIYEKDCHKKGSAFDKNKMHKLINFFKNSIERHEDWKNFHFDFSETLNYESIDKFYKEISEQGYKISFRNISEKYINRLVEENKLYLFQIYNKDFSEYSKGTPNMHTLYWKELFSEENLKNVVYKLNGEAEVFYRKKSLNYSDEILEKGHHYEKLKDKMKDKKTGKFYPIIKDKRFAFDKFQFHCPITLNFKAQGTNYINEEVNKFIKQNGIKHIIGIDRGERHLLYVSVIDLHGNIKDQFSLNEIANEYKEVDYQKLLAEKEGDRTKQRQEWKKIENIKELKQGYLSQVIHKISDLIVKREAIVVLEDLNFGFMRGRQKIEKSVYQQFEKMLIDKLNYLVFKKNDKYEAGGLLNALQLTNKFESFQKLGKQCGFLFYIPAWNTSKMCPVTGFISLFDTRYENVEKAKKFFAKFDSITFNSTKKHFEFKVDDYSKFSTKAENTRSHWTLCTHGTRIETFRNPDKNNNWDSREINLTEEYLKLLNIPNGDIKDFILQQSEKIFFERLLHLFKMTVQMRNSITNDNTDYLISPISDDDGKFFDTRNYEKTENAPYPQNTDANGAYNIARKGLIVIEKIKNADDLKKINLTISNKEWMQFAQGLGK